MSLLRNNSLRILAVCGILIVCFAGNAFAMKIYISTSMGRTVEMDARPDEKIDDVKSFVFDVIAVQQSSQILFKGDKELANNMTLSALGIAEGDTLRMIRSASGGEMAASDGTRSQKSGGSMTVVIIVLVVGVVVVAAIKMMSGKKK